jgi:hypothetical protein
MECDGVTLTALVDVSGDEESSNHGYALKVSDHEKPTPCGEFQAFGGRIAWNSPRVGGRRWNLQQACED